MLKVIGDVNTASVRHNLQLWRARHPVPRNRRTPGRQQCGRGTGNIFTLPAPPEAPIYQDPYITRKERGVEFFAFDAIQWTQAF
ncbi:MAG: hypothetical protein IPK05_19410 [Comamonadaceae bacterium]|nr:hypothetical protein [Comamonadaceae bacterium]